MQNKGAIRFVAIMFALVCLYQLSFTWKTAKVEKQAREYAKGDLFRQNVYLDSVASEPVYNLLVKEF